MQLEACVDQVDNQDYIYRLSARMPYWETAASGIAVDIMRIMSTTQWTTGPIQMSVQFLVGPNRGPV